MWKNLVLYNHYGHGDLFISREFIKEYMRLIPAENYIYSHVKNERIFADIDIGYMWPKELMRRDKAYIRGKDTLYINMWIGRNPAYVLPGIGCTLERYFDMYNDILRELGHRRLSGNVLDYLPAVDYTYYNIDRVYDFVGQGADRKVFIDNCKVLSKQSDNFDMTPAIDEISNEFPDIDFIVSTKKDLEKPNIYYTEDIIQSPDKFDLNEIAFLSTYTDTIIGRASGPHVFTMNKENIMDGSKANLTFSNSPNCTHLVFNTAIPIRKHWSGAKDTRGVVQKMTEVIGR
jgi:hypothetical protein